MQGVLSATPSYLLAGLRLALIRRDRCDPCHL